MAEHESSFHPGSRVKQIGSEGLPGIVAESLNKDLNPLSMSGLLLRNTLLMRMAWLMLGIIYKAAAVRAFCLLNTAQPELSFFSFQLRMKQAAVWGHSNRHYCLVKWFIAHALETMRCTSFNPHSTEQQWHRAVVTCFGHTGTRLKGWGTSPMPICILLCQWTGL